MSMEDLTFEQAMQRLEEIVSLLEDGKAPLNESMALFEEGTKLSAYLSQLLDTAEQKVTMITVRDGAETEIPFDTQEGE
ncbi:MAG: exodeoxyribonuclease VII small subunit [Butyricicoccus sp.]|uniref:Exodeoxyribonuclease 7 small subunit n=2 Tax=Butyricicoccaceae TaxID=3085642 RepID=A0ABS6EP07_9FIRM|nr:exodeoxyribonuclease VII small subunit [Butyricicoccus intestinisimiae]MBU5489422.1 exodeoxyribonuclease VII small subunit [Butyricicoccus intestinisimiae]MCI6326781.1 exodeoxyribonuclease VII small subunit [Clostridiales bacterium]MDD7624867.1 exodeoxyribonuclease VII small subunit [Butyricicoccus sp.]